MPQLLDETTLAHMVSHVSRVMFGVTFIRSDGPARGESLCGRMVRLPLRGGSGVEVVLSFDLAGSRALAAAFHSCPERSLTDQMIQRAAGELVKMVALHVQTALGIDRPLGTPRRTTLAEMAREPGEGWNDAVLLRSDGLGDLRLWVTTGRAARTTTPGDGVTMQRRGLRSFIQALLPF